MSSISIWPPALESHSASKTRPLINEQVHTGRRRQSEANASHTKTHGNTKHEAKATSADMNKDGSERVCRCGCACRAEPPRPERWPSSASPNSAAAAPPSLAPPPAESRQVYGRWSRPAAGRPVHGQSPQAPLPAAPAAHQLHQVYGRSAMPMMGTTGAASLSGIVRLPSAAGTIQRRLSWASSVSIWEFDSGLGETVGCASRRETTDVFLGKFRVQLT